MANLSEILSNLAVIYVIDSIWLVIAASTIVIISYLFNLFAKRTNIPSVLLLIVLGLGITYFTESAGVQIPDLFPILEIVGLVGVIMIVLEAALDIKLGKKNMGILIRAFLAALIILLITSGAVAWVLHYFVDMPFYTSLVYAVPLSVMSSAIIIPSVSNLVPEKKEFMVFESTFSDILGIMLFFLLVDNYGMESGVAVAANVSVNVVLTVIFAIVIGYLMIFLFQSIRTHERLFLMIALLVLLYAIGKLFHLSSLLIIFFFGLLLNNKDVFFRGFMSKLIHHENFPKMLEDFRIIIVESSFVVRTFFFVLFGMSIALGSLVNPEVYFITFIIMLVLFIVRYMNLKVISKSRIYPELFIAPRGLITILLFFSIPKELQHENFDPGILLLTILVTSVIMMIALISQGNKVPDIEEIKLEEIGVDLHAEYHISRGDGGLGEGSPGSEEEGPPRPM